MRLVDQIRGETEGTCCLPAIGSWSLSPCGGLSSTPGTDLPAVQNRTVGGNAELYFCWRLCVLTWLASPSPSCKSAVCLLSYSLAPPPPIPILKFSIFVVCSLTAHRYCEVFPIHYLHKCFLVKVVSFLSFVYSTVPSALSQDSEILFK